MHWINWLIIIGYLSFVAWDGLRRSRGTTEIRGYFLANRSLPWWAVGLSVMATQLSAITMIGTTGQGATDGLRFVQFYFGLPLAMVILGVTLVPFLHGANVFTAYEYLEKRFDAKTRSLTAFLFLLSRGLSCSVIISAPAIVFSSIFGWPISWSVAIMGVPTVLYTMIGGVQAVTWADVKQMVLVVTAIVSVIVVLLLRIPVSADDALTIAGSVGRMRAFDFSFNINETYTFWSGLIGGTFLMMSYFGTDQSQVQRYLTAKSVDEARSSLLISAYWKIPLQALILLTGVLVFVYYQFQPQPLLFNPAHARRVQQADSSGYAALQSRFQAALAIRRDAAQALATNSETDPTADDAFRAADQGVQALRTEALARAGQVTGEPTRDVNYIIPHFVLHDLPLGLAGIFLASVMAAAMSAVAAELNSLATATVIDFYRRWFRTEGSDRHFLNVSKAATVGWGIFACVMATFAASLGSLIEVVNRYGSFFYGSILGVFLLAMIKRATATGAFIGMIAGISAVAAVAFGAPRVSFLWHNVVGAVAVVAVGALLSIGRPTSIANE
ncbi:MAG: sodium:solute symporter [Gemmatimonadaceae bacterium]